MPRKGKWRRRLPRRPLQSCHLYRNTVSKHPLASHERKDASLYTPGEEVEGYPIIVEHQLEQLQLQSDHQSPQSRTRKSDQAQVRLRTDLLAGQSVQSVIPKVRSLWEQEQEEGIGSLAKLGYQELGEMGSVNSWDPTKIKQANELLWMECCQHKGAEHLIME